MLEKAGYNWDELECVIFADGRDQIERRNFDFESDLSSFPEKAVKIKYFWDKWLPIFDDGGGNFIGLDFDPDCAGHKGQVIIYGRDEEELTVLASDLSSFFEKILACLQDERRAEIFSDYHIHEALRNLVKAGKF